MFLEGAGGLMRMSLTERATSFGRAPTMCANLVASAVIFRAKICSAPHTRCWVPCPRRAQLGTNGGEGVGGVVDVRHDGVDTAVQGTIQLSGSPVWNLRIETKRRTSRQRELFTTEYIYYVQVYRYNKYFF